MKRRKLRGYVVPTLCTFLMGTIVYSGYQIYDILAEDAKVIPTQVENIEITSNQENITTTMEETPKTIIRPYTSTNVAATIPFYEQDGTEDEQISALIYYEGIYMQNTGVLYTANETFDVVAVLDGVVKNIKEDSIMGNIIEIESSNKVTTVYQSLGDIKVTIGSSISQGTIIATSGSNKLTTDNTNALHFEVIYNGTLMNPEEFYLLSYDEVMQ